MEIYPYSTLAEPESREHFSAAMEALSRHAGADRYLVIRLHGPEMKEIVSVVHNGGPAGDERLGASLHWSVERMLEAMRNARAPRTFGHAAEPGVDVAGYQHGVGAICREEVGGCVVYLGLHEAAADDERSWTLASMAQMCAQHAYLGLKARAPKACPLTAQELACLRLYGTSQNTKEAARTLGISVRTMESHLDRARIKCGVDNSLAAMALAVKEGWIDLKQLRALEATG